MPTGEASKSRNGYRCFANPVSLCNPDSMAGLFIGVRVGIFVLSSHPEFSRLYPYIQVRLQWASGGRGPMAALGADACFCSGFGSVWEEYFSICPPKTLTTLTDGHAIIATASRK